MLDKQLAAALASREARGTRRRLISPPQGIDFSSNDYLGVAHSKEAQHRVSERLGHGLAIGSTGSRLLDGDSFLHKRVEQRIARHFGAECALLFNSGFDANVSMLATLPQPGDLVVYDALVHASMHDGMRGSRARCVPFAHNSTESLDKVLADELAGARGDAVRAGRANVFLAIEGVYSMDGDVAPVRELHSVLAKHVPTAGSRAMLVDEAHSVGVYGKGGTGLCAALGACDLAYVRLVTFGKAFGCAGAAVLCTPLVRDYLLNYARPLVYSTALAPLSVAAIDAVLDMAESGELDRRAAQVHRRTVRLRASLGDRWGTLPQTPHELPPAPIIPLLTPHAVDLAAHLQQSGCIARAALSAH
ncbi:8-amino-7-oxononanoate synthase [Malassezia cuniculi]|uniref:8-amino-7-oxononanoate synthase n=1 Tax=Malassezia cuniculi TaxID=948313 RepID=A0AAF0JAU6_9BASI|nr:8-amino-7-oxononanoate synthase [Malassezia cuniculi]